MNPESNAKVLDGASPLSRPRWRSWTECEHLDRATDLFIDRVLFMKRRKEVVRRWREGRQEDIWRMGILAREWRQWVRADRQMMRDGHGVGARGENAKVWDTFCREKMEERRKIIVHPSRPVRSAIAVTICSSAGYHRYHHSSIVARVQRPPSPSFIHRGKDDQRSPSFIHRVACDQLSAIALNIVHPSWLTRLAFGTNG